MRPRKPCCSSVIPRNAYFYEVSVLPKLYHSMATGCHKLSDSLSAWLERKKVPQHVVEAHRYPRGWMLLPPLVEDRAWRVGSAPTPMIRSDKHAVEIRFATTVGEEPRIESSMSYSAVFHSAPGIG